MSVCKAGRLIAVCAFSLLLMFVGGVPLLAQAADPAPPSKDGPYRVFAPGVQTMIPSPVEESDTYSRHDLVEILAADAGYGERAESQGKSPAKQVRFEHKVWGLQFTFLPVRFVEVDVAVGNGRVQPKLVWYMVYHVKNSGPDPVRFVPTFVLEADGGKHSYPAQLIPTAVPVIQQREDPNRRLLDTIEIAGEVPPSTEQEDRSVWGVVTWADVDPTTDRFSIFIQGLTNAYRWQDEPGAYKPGDPIGTGRKSVYKTLQLNFWRPGDEQFQHEKEIRFGIPGEVDYRWLYR